MTLILATGGLGFIGSHTCVSLIQKGFDVLIIDSLINSSEINFLNIKKIISQNNKENIGNIFLRKGDLRNTIWLNKIFQEFIFLKKPIEAVIHFAGLKSVADSVKWPINYWDLNLNSSISLLKVMDMNDCNVIVFSSSATIYKPQLNKKLKEYSILEPINSYGNTKLSIEKFLNDVFKGSPKKWRIANLRYFNPVGSHKSGLLGEDPKGTSSNLFPTLVKVLQKKIDKLRIFGNDWPTHDGTCIRDYIHVVDLAESHVAALDYLYKNTPQIVSMNIGTGKGTSVLELVNKFSEVINFKLPFCFDNRRKGDTPYLVADNRLALELLEWKPNYLIDDMCKDTWNWLLKNPRV